MFSARNTTIKVSREYFAIEELPYGEEAQIDFGHYNMHLVSGGERNKVSFFAIVLSRSRIHLILGQTLYRPRCF
jgi:hypothetical protein